MADQKSTETDVVAHRSGLVEPRGGLSKLMERLEQNRPDLSAAVRVSSAAAEIGEMVRAVRLSAGMSQRELAEKADIHPSALSALECGDGKEGPSYRKLRDIARALGMRVSFVDVAGVRAEEQVRLQTGPALEEFRLSIANELATALPEMAAAELAGEFSRASIMVLAPREVAIDASDAKRTFHLMHGQGAFVLGGTFLSTDTVTLDPRQQVEIANTGYGDLVVIKSRIPDQMLDLAAARAVG